MIIKRVSIVVVLFLIGATNVKAQSDLQQQLNTRIAAVMRDLQAAGNNGQQKRAAVSLQQAPGLFALAVALRKEVSAIAVATDDVRVDKQVGGSDSNAGSTSLVSKGSIPSILGYAVENGALAREISGTTITFRGNPVGIIKALSKAGFTEGYVNADGGTQFLRRFSFALSFDTSRGNPAAGGSGTNVFTGDLQQLSSYSIRCDIVNTRDPRNKAYRDVWNRLFSVDVGPFALALDHLAQLLLADSVFQSWHQRFVEKLQSASDAGAEEVIRNELEGLKGLPLPDEIDKAAEALGKTYSLVLTNRSQILEDVAKGPIVTLEYTNIRKVDAVDQSNFKLIAEGAFFHGHADLTANASLTILNKIPAGSKLDRVQDIDLSGQIDVPLGEVQKIGSLVLSFSGKYKHVMQDTMMANGMMADTKGDTGVGQVKLTIPVKGSGVKIPISFTFANRTDLVKEKFVRGNIGITFDLDSIFARFKP
jgi:hypothetical protein